MKNKFTFFVVFIFWVFGVSVFAQEESNSRKTPYTEMSLSDINQNIMLARSSADYRVTPGDVYTLVYAAGSTPVTYVIVVDSSYRIRVSNLGIINGAGKTFVQLKNEVEATVANNYPLSGVQLVLTQPAVFRVHVNGEVVTAEETFAWGLSRLSSLVEKSTINVPAAEKRTTNVSVTAGSKLTDYTSIRDISIKSSNGQTRVYDLFKAFRYGDISQDPYLRPGDVITFNRIKRVVTVKGEVERPGSYQLLDGENIKELIEIYGSGFTPIADKARLEMVRLINSTDIAGDKIFLTERDLSNNYVLEHYDAISVPTITQLQSVMFVEGAVGIGITDELITTNRLVVQFAHGETYGSLIRRSAAWFSAVSDSRNAYILRSDERIPINLYPILYDASYRNEVPILENDTLVIPFRQYFITVAGSVAIPGRYPYIPDRDWEYYIALAGGFLSERNANNAITITDINGKKRKKTDAILPETTITASTNHFLYYFNLYSPIILTVLSLVTTIFTVQAVTR